MSTLIGQQAAYSRRDALEHWLGKTLNFDDRSRDRMWTALARFTAHGYQLRRGLESQLYRYNRDSDLRRTVWRRFLDGMASGLNFSSVVAAYVPPAERLMVSAGEESGRLSDGFSAAAYIARNTRKIKSTLRKALAYPAALLLTACGVLYLIATQFAPVMLDLEPNRARWPFISQLLYNVATFVEVAGLWVAIALVAAVVVSVRSLPGWHGALRSALDRWLPPYTIYREFQSATFIISLSSLVESGRPVREALAHMSSIASPWLKQHIQRMLRTMAEGIPPGQALKTGLINREVMGLIEDYGAAGTFDKALAQVGRDVVDDAIEGLERASGKVLAITLIVVAVLIVIAYGGMFSLAVQVGQGARGA